MAATTRVFSEPSSSSSSQIHTILCEKTCTTVHHELVCIIHKAANSTRAVSDKSFEDCTLRWLSRGFDRDSAVPDPDEKYQLPLVHLACIFGRHKALEFLLKNGFRVNVRNKFDETAVHVVLRLLYSGFSTSSNVERKMSISEKIIQILIDNEVDMLFKKDGRGNSPIQLCAYCLLNIAEQKRGKSNNNIFRILETQKRFFENCFRFMIDLMLRLRSEGRLHEVVLFQCLSSPNQRGDTLYQMLARNEGTKEQLDILVQHFPTVAPSDSPMHTPQCHTVDPQEQATTTGVPNVGGRSHAVSFPELYTREDN